MKSMFLVFPSSILVAMTLTGCATPQASYYPNSGQIQTMSSQKTTSKCDPEIELVIDALNKEYEYALVCQKSKITSKACSKYLDQAEKAGRMSQMAEQCTRTYGSSSLDSELVQISVKTLAESEKLLDRYRLEAMKSM